MDLQDMNSTAFVILFTRRMVFRMHTVYENSRDAKNNKAKDRMDRDSRMSVLPEPWLPVSIFAVERAEERIAGKTRY